jgi:trimethylamine:corrinoid methyltransferase-like protein
MNPAKKNLRAVLDVRMRTLGMLHTLIVRGYESSVLDEEQLRDCNGMIAAIESQLIQSGYMTTSEVKRRHTKKVEASDQTIIPYPFI